MQHASRFTQLSALAFGIAGALAVGQVHASGFQLKENSVKGLGAAFAGAGVNETDSSVVVNNPATMARFEGTTMQVDVTAIDTQGRPVRNLRQEDFKVYSDGLEQPISLLSSCSILRTALSQS